MAPDDALGLEASSGRRGQQCRHCKTAAVDPSFLTIDPLRLHERFLCDTCWLLLEIGFTDARPSDDLYGYLGSVDRRLSDAEVHHHILRGRVLLERRGGFGGTRQDRRGMGAMSE
jgi:hypothetical protein